MHDHRDYMAALAVEQGWKRGVEIGLGSGMLFARFLAAGLEMIGVDMGRRSDRRQAVKAVAAAHPSARVIWSLSVEAAPQVPDGWADFVFIDAGHSYEAARDDIAAWQAKVRPGGWLGGHDYHSAHPGVIRAVDEAFGRRVEALPFWIWTARPC